MKNIFFFFNKELKNGGYIRGIKKKLAIVWVVYVVKRRFPLGFSIHRHVEK